MYNMRSNDKAWNFLNHGQMNFCTIFVHRYVLIFGESPKYFTHVGMQHVDATMPFYDVYDGEKWTKYWCMLDMLSLMYPIGCRDGDYIFHRVCFLIEYEILLHDYILLNRREMNFSTIWYSNVKPNRCCVYTMRWNLRCLFKDYIIGEVHLFMAYTDGLES
jgi:hypothetical protein